MGGIGVSFYFVSCFGVRAVVLCYCVVLCCALIRLFLLLWGLVASFGEDIISLCVRGYKGKKLVEWWNVWFELVAILTDTGTSSIVEIRIQIKDSILSSSSRTWEIRLGIRIGCEFWKRHQFDSAAAADCLHDSMRLSSGSNWV